MQRFSFDGHVPFREVPCKVILAGEGKVSKRWLQVLGTLSVTDYYFSEADLKMGLLGKKKASWELRKESRWNQTLD